MSVDRHDCSICDPGQMDMWHSGSADKARELRSSAVAVWVHTAVGLELGHHTGQEQAYVSLYPSTHGYFLSVSFPQLMPREFKLYLPACCLYLSLIL